MICKGCNDEIDPIFGCWCMRVNGRLPEEMGEAVYAPRTVRNPDDHLGASEASFEKGWHPELDAGLETS